MENKVLASVNGSPITMEDVQTAISEMGQRGQSLMNEQGIQMVLEQLINRKLLLMSAKKDLLEFDPAFKAQLNRAKDELLTKFAISRAIESVKISDDEVKKFYDENPDKFSLGNTVTASHILVDSEEKAKQIKADISSGKISFADAAKQYSSCPSKDNGGELGTFGQGQMVKEFEDAAFALDLGTVSEPVQTQFGWHLILVSDKKEDSVMPYDEISSQLKEQLLSEKQQKAYASKINQLKILFPVDKY